MDDTFSTAQKHIKQQSLTDFLSYENKIPIKMQQQLLAFYGEDIVDISTVCHWVRKLRDSGGYVDLNNQPRSGRPVTATHYVNKKKSMNSIKKIEEFLRES